MAQNQEAAIRLADLSSSALSQSVDSSQIPALSVQSIWATLSVLQGLIATDSQNTITFNPAALTIADDYAGKFEVGDVEISRIRALVLAAHDAANSHACSSVLAGQGSESDEYGDIGLCLGVVQGIDNEGSEKGKAAAVFRSIGLGGILESQPSQILPITLSPDLKLPSTFKCTTSDASVARFTEAFQALGLSEEFAFSLDCSEGAGGVVVHILIGRTQDHDPRWLGLLGVGTWT